MPLTTAATESNSLQLFTFPRWEALYGSDNEIWIGRMSTRTQRISPLQPELRDVVLACFRQACSENRLDVAEHLLVAVEELSKADAGVSDPESNLHLAEAYAVILEVMPTRQSADASECDVRQ